MSPRTVILTPTPCHLDRGIEDIIRVVFNQRTTLGGGIQTADALIEKEALIKYRAAYGREPRNPAEATRRLNQQEINTILKNAKRYRRNGFVFIRAGQWLIGIREDLWLNKDKDSLLGRAVETAMIYIAHQAEKQLRNGQSMEFELNVEELLLWFDPSGNDKNARSSILKAINTLSGTVVIFIDNDTRQTQLTPVLKSVVHHGKRVRIAVNEYFIGAVVNLVAANAASDPKQRKELLKGVSYFKDDPTRQFLRNSPPKYTRTQRNIQGILFSKPNRKEPTNHDYIRLHLGTVEKLIDAVGYHQSRPRRQLSRLVKDMKRVIVDDAGGVFEPSLDSLLDLPTKDAFRTKLLVRIPADFASRLYPQLIKDRSGLNIIGDPYDRHIEEGQKLQVQWANGLTGTELRDWRIKLHLTQEQVAKHAGINRRSIIRYEKQGARLPMAICNSIAIAIEALSQPGKSHTNVPKTQE